MLGEGRRLQVAQVDRSQPYDETAWSSSRAQKAFALATSIGNTNLCFRNGIGLARPGTSTRSVFQPRCTTIVESGHDSAICRAKRSSASAHKAK